jgi:hypothetical protein
MRLLGSPNEFNTLLSIGEGLFAGANPPQVYDYAFGEEEARPSYRRTIAASYVDISAYQLTEILKNIQYTALRDVDSGASFTSDAHTFLIMPSLKGLRKTSVYPSGLRDSAMRFYEFARPDSESFFAPCWLADVCENLGVTAPVTMDTDQIHVLRKNNEKFVSAVKSLDEEIDRTISEKFGGQELERDEEEAIMAKKEEFRRRWTYDVVPAFEDIRKTEQVWSIAFTNSIVSSLINLLAFTGVLNVSSASAALLASEKIKKVADPAAEYFVRFWERNPIHIGFYKVDKEIKRLKSKST